jgi:hypothetical protein
MKIIYPNCNESVPVRNVELKDQIAKCMNCDNIFNFNDHLVEANGDNTKEEVKSDNWGSSNKLILPEGFKVQKDNDQLIIKQKWFSKKFIALAIFLFFWDGITFTIFYLALSSGEIVPVMFISLFCLVGIGLTYYMFAGFLNTTVIKVTSTILSISHDPLPWPGNEEGPSRGIEQLYVSAKRHRSRNAEWFDYSLNLVSHSGQNIELITGLEKDQAKYIEKKSNNF